MKSLSFALMMGFILAFPASAQVFNWVDYYPQARLLTALITYNGPAEREFTILPVFDEQNRLVLTIAWEDDLEEGDVLNEQLVTLPFDPPNQTIYADLPTEDGRLILASIWTPEPIEENRNEYQPLLRLRRQVPFYNRLHAGPSS